MKSRQNQEKQFLDLSTFYSLITTYYSLPLRLALIAALEKKVGRVGQVPFL